MDAATVSSIMAGALALEAEQQSAKQKYFSELSPHFAGARYFRLYQLETKIEVIFRYGWTKNIPLVVTEEELKILQQGAEAQEAAAREEQRRATPTT